MICSSIDLGTNTCLLLIAELDGKTFKIKNVILDVQTVVRLGQGVDQNQSFCQEAMDRTLNCLQNYKNIINDNNIKTEDSICIATSQARDSKNGLEFFKQVQKETGLKFSILTGDQEAKYSFLGAVDESLGLENPVVIDIGGGSTEYITSPTVGKSLDIGSVRFTERYLKSDPATEQEFLNCQNALDVGIKSLNFIKEDFSAETHLIGVAGTVTTIASWALGLKSFDPQKIHGFLLTQEKVFECVSVLKSMTVEQRRNLVGIEPMRADVLLAGAMVLWRSMVLLGFNQCAVSTRGLRYGVLDRAFLRDNASSGF